MISQSPCPQEEPEQSFFVTSGLQPKIIHREPSKPIFEISYNIQDWLENTERMLEQKRQRALLHSQRMKELQKEFLERQSKRQRSLEERQESSEKLKHKNIAKVQQRLRKISQRRTKIGEKVKLQTTQTLRRHLQQRKSFQPDPSRFNSNLSQVSQKSASQQRIQVKEKQIRQAQHQVQEKLEDFKEKQEHAHDASVEYKQYKTMRARSHNLIEIPYHRQRAEIVKAGRIQAQSQDAFQRLESLAAVRKKKEKLSLDKSQSKRKSESEKMRRIKHNLYDIDEKKKKRCQQLDNLFEKQVNRSHWREARSNLNTKRLLDNLQAIEHAQQIKAQRILSKHKQDADRNKKFRERRDYLYQIYKNQTIT